MFWATNTRTLNIGYFQNIKSENGHTSPILCKIITLTLTLTQNGETPYYLEKLILPLDSQTQCFLFDVQ